MDVKACRDVVSIDAQIAVVVSQENFPAHTAPLSGVIELLIQTALEPEGFVSYLPS